MTKTLWNHTLEGSYPAEELRLIPGVWRYGARALSCTGPEDTIQLHRDLEPEFPWILDHYRRVGLTPSADVLWDADLGQASRFPEHHWDVFLYSKPHHAVRRNDDWLRASVLMNSKNEFIQLCRENGFRTPPTRCFRRKAEALAVLDEVTFPLYRKTACSAAGAGVVLCQDRAALLRDLETIGPEVEFQLQHPVREPVRFLNVQYEVVKTACACRVAITEQVLDGFSHAGNRFPAASTAGIWETCDPVADQVAKLGLKGMFAFDVAVDGTGQALLIECNPRWNACTYYWKVANRFHIPHWQCRNQSVRCASLNELDLGGLEFKPAIQTGAIVISWGTVLDHKLGVLFCGRTAEECEQLQREFSVRNGKLPH